MKELILAVYLSVIPVMVLADSTGSLFSELDIGKGARASAMGMANTSISDDSSGIYWNPAGLGRISENQISFSYNKWFLDSSVKTAETALKLGSGSLGLGFVHVDMGEFDYIDPDGFLTGQTIRPYTIAFSAGYANQTLAYYDDYNVSIATFKLFTGLSFKFISNNDGYENSTALVADAGAIFVFTGIADAGIAVKNLKIATNQDVTPSLNLGISRMLFNDSLNKVKAAVDLHAWLDGRQEICGGAEYSISDYIFLRAGYVFVPGYMSSEGTISGLNGGLGVRMESFRFDYAFTTHGGLGANHSVTVIFYPGF
ncbi:MAG: hypothetical protein CVV21_01555 [Candidatus Goldiibacteriota bacterium HGW-Goldbacteria-1]|jgi:hypothetical protein|nr:MAG: hypothetical protein CVV21_01555 [Candidatus Goldiibacteriota bacterium HGW-Goldbacteria-1]